MIQGNSRKTIQNRRRKRREQYDKLRTRYASSRKLEEKRLIMEKLLKIAPWLSDKEADRLIKLKR